MSEYGLDSSSLGYGLMAHSYERTLVPQFFDELERIVHIGVSHELSYELSNGKCV